MKIRFQKAGDVVIQMKKKLHTAITRQNVKIPEAFMGSIRNLVRAGLICSPYK
jgi:hypothetical protein